MPETGIFEEQRRLVNDALDDARRILLPRVPQPLREVIEYALSGEGKRVRGVLVMLAHAAAGGSRDVAGLAGAVEIVHAYSLVHDDLPCMDDDDFRRGRLTVHRAFDVESATVAGVAMVPLAVLSTLHGARRAGLPHATAEMIVRILLDAAGSNGMIGGQFLDLDAEGRALPVPALERVHRGKTGALFGAAARIGGTAAGVGERQADALQKFGVSLGLAFQIADDVLDAAEAPLAVGKTSGRDAELHKSTYPAAIGVPSALERARVLVQEGCGAIDRAGLLTEDLARLSEFAVTRTTSFV